MRMAGQEKMRIKMPAMEIKRMSVKKNVFVKMKYWLEKGGEFFGSLLFPPRCVVCDEILTPEELEKGIHLACENKLFPVEGAVCMHCGRPLGQIQSRKEKMQTIHEKKIPGYMRMEYRQEYCRECMRKGYVSVQKGHGQRDMLYGSNLDGSNITQAKSLYLYKGAIKISMYRFKYGNKREYARYFARQAIEKYGEWLHTLEVDVIVPVPMYLPKQRRRGYNQAECFATELSKWTGIPMHKNYIRRVKDTTPQKNLKDIERKNNLENAFQKTENIVQYNHILIVDDIYTTGYTAEAVAKELRKQGSHHIYLLSICIGGNH